MPTITRADISRLQAKLRDLLHSPALSLEPPGRAGASVEVKVAGQMLGTVEQVDEDGERSWAVTLIILEEDLGAG